MNSAQAFLRSFFTEHLLAKFFAVIFAGITVYLIDRDISSPTEWENKRFAIRLDAEDDAPKTTIRILLRSDPRVWVGDFPEDLKVRISGPKNLEAAFRADPIIRLDIDRDLVPRDVLGISAPSIVVNSSNFKAQVSDRIIIEPLEECRVEVDMIERLEDVSLALGSRIQVTKSRVIDAARTSIDPAVSSISGPRHQINQYDGTGTPLVVAPKDRSVLDGSAPYPLEVQDGALSVRLTGDPAPALNLALKQPEPDIVDLGAMPFYWALTDDLRAELADEQVSIKRVLEFKQVNVKIMGPPRLLDPLRQNGDTSKLKGLLRIVADPNRQIGEVLKDPREVEVPLVVLGLPAGLSAELLPDRLRIGITRNTTEKK